MADFSHGKIHLKKSLMKFGGKTKIGISSRFHFIYTLVIAKKANYSTQ